MEGIKKFFDGEPVVVQNFIVAVAAAAAAFGFNLTGEQVAAVVGVAAAVSMFFARHAVTPVAAPDFAAIAAAKVEDVVE
jgi:hypothetical protein